jgi:hypothetical protein
VNLGRRVDSLRSNLKLSSKYVLVVDISSKFSDEDRQAISTAFKFSHVILWDSTKPGKLQKIFKKVDLRVKKNTLFPFTEKRNGDYVALARFARKRSRVKIFSNGGDIVNFVEVIPVKKIVDYAKQN